MISSRFTLSRSARYSTAGKLRLGVLLAVVVAPLAACDAVDRLLEVDTPSRIPAEVLEVPTNAALLVTSAVADFDCALGAYVVLGALVGEELRDATQTADRYPYDQRNFRSSDRRYSVFDCESLGIYTPLQTARASSDRILGLLKGWSDADVPNRTSLIATAAAYAGYTRVLLGEGFCSMAFSEIVGGRTLVFGGEISRDSVFKEAEAKFSEAIQAATTSNNNEIRLMALLGRARARLNLRKFAEAKADAAQIPAGFVKNATASTTSGRRQNRVFSNNNPSSFATSVDTTYFAKNDPRVPVVREDRVSVTGVRFFRQAKYTEATSSIPIATYEEARLIIAEAELEAGRLTEALTEINASRARGGQLPFVSVDPAAIRAELIEQRRRELFLEGHHLGDVIRFNIRVTPPAGSAFQGGGVHGTDIGNQLCLPLPDIERLNNPNVPDTA